MTPPSLLHDMCFTRIVKTSETADSTRTRLNEKDHHRTLFTQLREHAAKWRIIGTHLGFHQGELDNIQSNPMLLTQGPPLSYLSELLSTWLQWAPGDGRGSKDFATLEALKDAVSQAGFGRTALDLTIIL